MVPFLSTRKKIFLKFLAMQTSHVVTILLILALLLLIVQNISLASFKKQHEKRSFFACNATQANQQQHASSTSTNIEQSCTQQKTIIHHSSNTCSFNVILPSVKRSLSQYNYLNSTLHSFINEIVPFSLPPCFTIYLIAHPEDNLRLLPSQQFSSNHLQQQESIKVASNQEQQHFIQLFNLHHYDSNLLSFIDLRSGQSRHESAFSRSGLTTQKRRQAHDVLFVLKHLHSSNLCSVKGNDFFLLMEDDFEMCKGGYHHFLRVLQYATTIDSNSNKKKWTAIRTSFGLSGILLKCSDLSQVIQFLTRNGEGNYDPIDWMLEKYWTQQGRELVVYRYQLFKHIGVESTIGNENQRLNLPECYDLQVNSRIQHEFDVKKCVNHYFTPCDSDSEKLMNDDMLSLASSSSILDLQKIEPSSCLPFENCNECCNRMAKQKNKNSGTCQLPAFPNINHCQVLQKEFQCNNCVDDISTGESNAPHFDGINCVINTSRKSRFNCNHKNERDVRLCPCKFL